MATKRYVLTGGTLAFINGERVDLGEVFEYDDKDGTQPPPKFSKCLDVGEAPPTVDQLENRPPTAPNLSLHEMQTGKVVARPSDKEPV